MARKMTDEARNWLNSALQHKDPTWAAFHCLRHEDLAAMDHELVALAHPLAFEAGTQIGRFMELHRQGFRF